MGASDLPLHVRQRIESKWSARVKREQLQRAAVTSETVGECRRADSEQDEQVGVEPSPGMPDSLQATALELTPVTGNST